MIDVPGVPDGSDVRVGFVEDPGDWIESAVRMWEVDVNAEGWEGPPRLGWLMYVPDPGGLMIAEVGIPREVIEPPHHLLKHMAMMPAAKLRRRFLEPSWVAEGWQVVGVVLMCEAWAIRDDQLNLSIFRGASFGDHPARIEQRRVMVAGPTPEREFTLTRTRHGVNPPEITRGIEPEFHLNGPDAGEDYTLRDNLRTIARKMTSGPMTPGPARDDKPAG